MIRLIWIKWLYHVLLSILYTIYYLFISIVSIHAAKNNNIIKQSKSIENARNIILGKIAGTTPLRKGYLNRDLKEWKWEPKRDLQGEHARWREQQIQTIRLECAEELLKTVF